ncbi:MAG: tRNA epoxyqueuosine(34) reductase QueG [Chlamydiales bacterium]|nr:tRNA epoxyqueuosine(34) reductase QueG [Chlamydiia bacterium]MCP5507218.1 tRNA epoxyqueuosine(34) reductase QueG [Chlamydiales bacterium]
MSGSDLTYDELMEKAQELGWDDMGITQAEVPEEDIAAYRDWLKNNYHGDLHYMENQMRCAPQTLLPGAKSAIVFVSYYKQQPHPFKKGAGLIASYARGRKYHNVHYRRLKKFIRWLEERTGQTGIAKGFSDSAPVLEKALAVRAGLGWFGKNTLLIHRRFGTFTLLSGLFTTIELPEPLSMPRLPRCGSCTRCLDACPTGALISPYRLDATKCLSYHLIESKEEIPEEIKKKNPGYLFGCDICQDSCPHNVRKEPLLTGDFTSDRGIGAYLTLDDLIKLEEDPDTLHGTPLQRQGIERLKKNFQLFN